MQTNMRTYANIYSLDPANIFEYLQGNHLHLSRLINQKKYKHSLLSRFTKAVASFKFVQNLMENMELGTDSSFHCDISVFVI